MIYLPVRIPLLLLSATVGNPYQIAKWLESIRGQKCTVIESHDRPVPLYPLFIHPSGTLFPLMDKSKEGKREKLSNKVYKFNKTQRRFSRGPFGKLPPFAEILDIPATELIAELMKNGIMATINEEIDYDTAAIIAEDLDYTVSEDLEVADNEMITLEKVLESLSEPLVMVTVTLPCSSTLKLRDTFSVLAVSVTTRS